MASLVPGLAAALSVGFRALSLFLVGCLLLDLNAFRAIAAGWNLVAGLRGTHVEVSDPKHYILLRLV